MTVDPTPTAPVLALDVRADPGLVADLAALGRALEAARLGGVVVSGDAERGELHPVLAAAALAPHTHAIALLARTDAVDVEPFHLATQLMSLDHVSLGRAGWLVEARSDEAAAAAVGREALSGADLEREVADVVRTARLVWDSWADDAVVRDVERGVYMDASRLQYVDAETATFSVRGPSITPRSPQGLVPVLVADEDAAAVGGTTVRDLADGRARDVEIDPTADASAIVAAVRAALEGARDDEPAPRLVRLLEAGFAADPEGRALELAQAADELRDLGLVAPAPAPGTTLRSQLSLARPDVVIDPARRADRARTA